MKFFIAMILVVMFPMFAIAEISTVTIPGKDWSISFDAPPLSNKQAGGDERDFRYSANAGRFNVSLFVEAPRGKGRAHQECFNYYWSKSNNSPLIDQNSVDIRPGDKYYRLQYDLAGKFRGQDFRQTHVNYYFVYDGKWIDVHISIINPTRADEEIFSAFDRSLSYGR